MLRPIIAVIATSATLLCATAANAGGTNWSVGINLPEAGVVISNGGYYAQAPAPVYYPAPGAYYHAPAPVYVPQAVVYAGPQPGYAVPYYGGRGGYEPRWEHRRAFEQARWQHARYDRGDRGEYRGDNGDARRTHRD
jgi:hypothetical protein